ncbi:MAG TPA: penicillin-binding transpeptidase domain-containing protein, partial [Microthrixaceae bacterium]|nr:penicillin-binding transpeptidase domain-containing protein [Microthrixaceae bacterium]
RIQVDARGDYLTTVEDAKARPGDDIWLTVDLDVQAYAEQLLQQRLSAMRGQRTDDGKVIKAPQGSVVITNPQSGEILAMASYPTYDPAQLVNGIDSDLWAMLNDKAQGQPLFNWALQGTYAPGSTFKLFTATAALESGFLKPGNDSIRDGGSYKVRDCKGESCTFRNAGGRGNGQVEITKSLTVSSDVFYYWIADGLWQNRATYGESVIQDWAAKYGLGSKSGVALPGEGRGKLPTPEIIRKQHEENPEAFPRGSWFTGDNLNTSIGQGDVLVTPLQLVNGYATFANGGNRLTPLIVSKVTRPNDVGANPGDPANHTVVRIAEPVQVGQVPFTADHYQKIAAGLEGVVMAGNGTAAGVWQNNRTAWPMAGKTGTAQVRGKADTSVFVAYGPTGPGAVPTYAISVVIPEAGFGADVAAPIAFQVMKPISEGAVPPATPAAPVGPNGSST